MDVPSRRAPHPRLEWLPLRPIAPGPCRSLPSAPARRHPEAGPALGGCRLPSSKTRAQEQTALAGHWDPQSLRHGLGIPRTPTPEPYLLGSRCSDPSWGQGPVSDPATGAENPVRAASRRRERRGGRGTGGGVLSPSRLHLLSRRGGPRAQGSGQDDPASTEAPRLALGRTLGTIGQGASRGRRRGPHWGWRRRGADGS